MRPIIIGAGPIGCYTASLIKNLKPVIIEEHKVIGRPLQCAGLINKRIDEIIRVPRKLILNKVRGAKLFSSKEQVLIETNKTQAFVIDRAGFDKHLAKLSRADIRLGEKVKSSELNNDLMNIKTNKQLLKTELLIDASGPGKPDKFVLGVQARARLNKDESFVELHFNSPGFFSWVIPEGDGVCRIGLGCDDRPADRLNSFLRKQGVKKVVDRQAGLIPLKVKPFCFDHLIRIGDSAGQVKATTGGGIITGLLSASHAAKAVLRAYETNDFSKRLFKEQYHKPWLSAVGRELKYHSMIRGFLNKLSPKGYDLLIKFVNHNKQLIEQHGDMDFPSKLLFKLIRPRNLVYGIRLLSQAISGGKV